MINSLQYAYLINNKVEPSSIVLRCGKIYKYTTFGIGNSLKLGDLLYSTQETRQMPQIDVNTLPFGLAEIT